MKPLYMDIAKKLNRDYYISMRIKGYSHESLIGNVFPPERTEKFISDVSDLKNIDFTKKVNVEKLVDGVMETKVEKKSQRKPKPNTALGERPGFKRPIRKKEKIK